MPRDFRNLKTERFRRRMRPAAERIYQQIFPGCTIEDLREDGVRVHVLDKHFGIDTLATMPSGQWISIQEKYRKHWVLKNRKYRVNPRCPDFTQEFKNAAGTKHEEPGEWFHLGAQLYFYGWANEQQSDFAAWVLIDIPRYKMLVREYGGLDQIGKLRHNKKHGRASFYCFPVLALKPAIVKSHLPDRYLVKVSATPWWEKKLARGDGTADPEPSVSKSSPSSHKPKPKDPKTGYRDLFGAPALKPKNS